MSEWDIIVELSSILEAERNGLAINRGYARELAEQLQANNPDIGTTLANICQRMADPAHVH